LGVPFHLLMTASRITTPFGFTSTAAEVIAGVDLSGKRAIVTGASSGIGVETARALADAGAAVTLAVRNIESGEQVAAAIRENTGNDAVAVGALDLSDLTSVVAFAAAWRGPLDILVNNAGVMAIQELTISKSGHEMQFATNHLGHFALALRLHDSLAAAGSARIVSVSSGGRYFENCNEAVRVDRRGGPGQGGVAPYALDPANAERLWELSLTLIQ
jgi:nucleoside-diphosphate-sugar epimerase